MPTVGHRRCASSSATAGAGLGSSPWAVRTRAVADGDRRGRRCGRCRATSSAAQTPTTSTIASSAPTSWNSTSSGSMPWTAPSTSASARRPLRRRSRHAVGRGRRRRAARGSPRAGRCVWCVVVIVVIVVVVGDDVGPRRARCRSAGRARTSARSRRRRGRPSDAGDRVEVGAGVDQRAEQHVAGDAGEAVEPHGAVAVIGAASAPRRRRRRSRCRCRRR